MIKLNNLNKYFNRNKRNEIHVINNVDLEFPETGIVCLLGPSGSGKTTLLNVIGGLDNANSGTIEIDGSVINKHKESTWNYYRNHKFGYIFQNYLLIPDINVYQNLEFSLKVYNLPSDVVEERIDYALKAVGMEKFKYRKPTELSGGQQQRVSIARALIKSPDVFIADEPTGNIDEKNTTQIMNILKKLSKNSLIILVTHERRLAEFYGDRIIELKDGEIIKDYLNKASETFNTIDDKNIYLKELELESKAIKDVEVNYFYKDKLDDAKIMLNVIYLNNTFYIQAKDVNAKIKFLDNKNEIKVIDSKKPVFDLNYVNKTEYQLDKIKFDKVKKSSVFKTIDLIKMAIASISNLKLIQKIMIFIFLLASIFLTFGITSYNESFYVNETHFLKYNRDIVEVSMETIKSVDDLKNITNMVEADYLLPEHMYMTIPALYINEFYQRQESVNINNVSIYPLDSVRQIDLKYGHLPTNSNELVIDLHLVNQLLESSSIRNKGIKRLDQFLGISFMVRNNVYNIVGIIDNNNPNLYILSSGYKIMALNNTMYLQDMQNTSIISGDFILPSYEIFSDSGIIIKDNLNDLELMDNQILVSKRLFDKNKNRIININGTIFDIVGVFSYRNAYDEYIYLKDDQLNKFYEASLLKQKKLTFISDNKTKSIEILTQNNVFARDVYREDYQNNVILEKNTTALFYSTVVVIFTLIFLYFIMRSSVTSKVYTIGVYRSLGVSKSSVLKIFIIEILLITMFSSFIGVVLFSTVILKVNSVANIIYYPLYVPLISFIIMFLLNSIIGILPVLPILRQTPSQILSRFD